MKSWKMFLLLVLAMAVAPPVNAQEEKGCTGLPEALESHISARQARVSSMLDHAPRAESAEMKAPEPVTPEKEGKAKKEPEGVLSEKVVNVDCDKGESVTKAILHSKAWSLTVNIKGTCREAVFVERPRVTLSGTKAGGATIDPPEDESGNPSLDAIQALGAHMLVVEDLTLIHANTGYSAASSHATQLTRVTATGNVTGVTLNRSSATISGSDLSENETPLIVVNASTAIVSNSTMNDNTFDGPWAQRSSNMSLTRCSILNNPWGVQAMNHSRATVNDSAISITELNDPNFSFAGDDSTLQMSNCTHRGHILAYNSSRALLNVVDQGEPAGTDMIWLQRGSYLVVTGSSVIRGDIDVGSFCDAEIDTPDAVDGSITCSVRHSRLWINQDPTGGASGCE